MAYEIFRNLYETNFDKDVSPWPVEPPRGHIVTFLDVFECEGLLYVTASCSTFVVSKSERKRNNITIFCQIMLLEPVCCKKRQKSPNQETGLGNRGRLFLKLGYCLGLFLLLLTVKQL